MTDPFNQLKRMVEAEEKMFATPPDVPNHDEAVMEYHHARAVASIAAILAAWEKDRKATDIAINALSDIATSTDMTLPLARNKANRIANELRTITKGTQ